MSGKAISSICSRKVALLWCAIVCIGSVEASAQFVIAIGGADSDEGRRVVPDGAGGAFAAGTYAGTVDFNPGGGVLNLTDPTSSGHVYLAHYDGSGDVVFAVGFGNDQFIGVAALAPDGSGGMFISGVFKDTLDIDPGAGTTNLVSNGGFDIYLARFDGSGNLVFGTSIGNSDIGGSETSTDLLADGAGGVFMTGYFYGTMDFDPGAGTADLTASGALGGSDLFLARYDASGGYLSAFGLGDSGSDTGQGLAPDEGGGLYLTGMFAGTVDFDPGGGTASRTSAGSRDIYVARYDTNGTFMSVISFGGVNGESVNAVAADDSGGVFVTGSFFGGADFDPSAGTLSHTSEGSDDIFLAHYDSMGAVVFAHAFGTSAASEKGSSVHSDGAGGVYMTGTFQNTVDFDPDTSTTIVVSNGGTDVVLAHYTSMGAFISAAGFGGSFADDSYWLEYGGPDQIFLTGNFQGTADFDPGSGTDNRTSNGTTDIFLLRLSNIPTPAATSMMSVAANGTVDFGSDVAVCIDFDGVFGPGDVTVERYEAPVQSPEGVDEPVVYESHWRIVASFGLIFGSTTVVRFKLDNLPNGTFPDPSNVQFYKRSLYGAGLLVPITTTYDEATNELRVTGFDSFSEFVAGGDVEAELPVELSGFSALVDGFDVRLAWSAASETDNAGFEVQHAREAGDFEPIAFVEGRGTTRRSNDYGHTVENLDPGLHRFRLKQIDFDGTFVYSRVVEAVIELPGTHLLSEAYPNPFNPSSSFTLTVAREQRVRIDLFDAAGRHVRTLFEGILPADKPREVEISGGSLPSGLYLYRAIGEAFSETRGVTLVR